MGRRKIEIQPITHDRNRSVTFLKRKNGLFKKAFELGVLCSVDVCVIIFGHNGKLHEYCSGDSATILERRVKFAGDRDIRRPSDFGGSKVTGDHDDDEDDLPDSGVDEPASSEAVRTSAKPGDSRPVTELPTLGASVPSYPPSSHNIADLRPRDYGEASGFLQISSGLPPASHPLSISSNHSSFSPTPASSQPYPQSISHHHQQLAHQFLVQQLQNINPNLNHLAPSRASPHQSSSHSDTAHDHRHLPPINSNRHDSIPSTSLPPPHSASRSGTGDSFANPFLSLLAATGATSANGANFGGFSSQPEEQMSVDLPWPKSSSGSDQRRVNPADPILSRTSSGSGSGRTREGNPSSSAHAIDALFDSRSREGAAHSQRSSNKEGESSTWLDILSSIGGMNRTSTADLTAGRMSGSHHDPVPGHKSAADILFPWETPSLHEPPTRLPPLPTISTYPTRESMTPPGGGLKRRRDDSAGQPHSPGRSPSRHSKSGSIHGSNSGGSPHTGTESLSEDEMGNKRRRE